MTICFLPYRKTVKENINLTQEIFVLKTFFLAVEVLQGSMIIYINLQSVVKSTVQKKIFSK